MVQVHPAVPTKHLKSLHYFHTDEWPLRRDLPIGSKEVPRVRRKATMCVRMTHSILHDDIVGYASLQPRADALP